MQTSSPVNIVQLVHRVDGQDHLRQVEFRHVLRQTVLKLAQQGQQVSTYIVVHHQVLQEERREAEDDVRM